MFFNPTIKSFAFCASMTHLVWLSTAKSRIAVISSGENQASIRALVCSGAVGALPLLDMIEDLIICVMFGSLVVYVALFSQGTLGLPSAIFPVTLIVGTSYSIAGAFDFFPPQVFVQTIFDNPAAVYNFAWFTISQLSVPVVAASISFTTCGAVAQEVALSHSFIFDFNCCAGVTAS